MYVVVVPVVAEVCGLRPAAELHAMALLNVGTNVVRMFVVVVPVPPRRRTTCHGSTTTCWYSRGEHVCRGGPCGGAGARVARGVRGGAGAAAAARSAARTPPRRRPRRRTPCHGSAAGRKN